jgi:hypothetical protein
MCSANVFGIHLQLLTLLVRPLSEEKNDDMAEYAFFPEFLRVL